MTKNFTIKEVFEWPKYHNLKAETRAQLYLDMLLEWNEHKRANAQRIAEVIQEGRDWLNAQNPEYNGGLGLRATSWFRPFAWELRQKRNGKSTHKDAHAVDVTVVGANGLKEHSRLMAQLFEHWKDHDGGLAAKRSGKLWSFIHIDLGRKRRWNY